MEKTNEQQNEVPASKEQENSQQSTRKASSDHQAAAVNSTAAGRIATNERSANTSTKPGVTGSDFNEQVKRLIIVDKRLH